jgi:ATP-binding protein involved in chromosome partitioning
MSAICESSVLDALKVVTDPDLGRDIVSLGFVKNMAIQDGRVSFTIELTTPACPVKDQMRDQAQAAASQVAGVTSVEVEMTASVRSAAAADSGPTPIQGIKNIIAVGAGKGGVGKTTVAVNLAVALAHYGGRVGIIDGDVYGPNVPIMLGLDTQLTSEGKKIIPAEKYGIRVVSMGFLADSNAPIIWRGPMLHGVVRQFFQDVLWGELDYLVIDMPPGTGDVALSLTQTVPVAGAIVVTTPQGVSLADTRRAVGMYRKLNVPTLGVIENMSSYLCPGCGRESDIFGAGGGEALGKELDIPFLGRLPIYEPIRIGSDTGRPIVTAEPDSAAARAFMQVAERTAAQISIASYEGAASATPAS